MFFILPFFLISPPVLSPLFQNITNSEGKTVHLSNFLVTLLREFRSITSYVGKTDRLQESLVMFNVFTEVEQLFIGTFRIHREHTTWMFFHTPYLTRIPPAHVLCHHHDCRHNTHPHDFRYYLHYFTWVYIMHVRSLGYLIKSG